MVSSPRSCQSDDGRLKISLSLTPCDWYPVGFEVIALMDWVAGIDGDGVFCGASPFVGTCDFPLEAIFEYGLR